MTATIAAAFRALNTQLLYREGLLNSLLKAPYLMSIYFFKLWVRRKRPETLTTINNFDRNIKIQVDLSKTMGASIFWTGFHEFNEMRFLNTFLEESMVFVDVGANQGEFSLFAAKRLQKGMVLAFEPTSFFFERLNTNIKLNGIGNIKHYKLGLSDHAGEVPIFFNEDNALNHEGLASLYPVNQKEAEVEMISVGLLDDIVVRDCIPRVDFIKIDVEGSEWAVLKGSRHVLNKYKPALMIELNDHTAAMAGYTVNDMMAWLREFGYEPYQIGRNGLAPLRDRAAFCNAVFLSR